MRRLLVLLALLGVVVSCSASTAGNPAPQTAAPSSVVPEPPGVTLPPRPRELRLDGIEACALLTSQQRADLGLQGQPIAGQSKSQVFAGPTCSITGFKPRDVDVFLTLARGNGIRVILDPGIVRDQPELTAVKEFPAVISRSQARDYCSVDVDVADGQLLDVQFADAGKDPPIPQDQLCRDAAQVATAVIETLQAKI